MKADLPLFQANEATAPRRALLRTYVDLFLISFAILFFELACIRWFGSTVVFMTFFTNFVLMACFLGMTVGCLTAAREQNYISAVIPLTLLAVSLAYLVFILYMTFGRIMIDVGGQGSPQQIYFGTEYRPRDPSYFIIPIEVLAGLFYVLIALMFVGTGQVMGRKFNAVPNHIAAYTVNIAGSLVGIAAFAAASHFRTPPILWFAICLGICLYFVEARKLRRHYAPLAALLILLALPTTPRHMQTFWSPYYKINYEPQGGIITTNNIGHQTMSQIGEKGSAYVLPHLLNRDVGRPPFEDVLIIGAGSGNDVQAALSHGAKRIDAVEIDPVLYEIGRADHPDRPYDDPRVTIHLDDGRSFARKVDRTYDLIVYALVDSLVLHTGYSSLRLESFLFTEQAFKDIKARLMPNGVFAMYNFYRQGWVVGRLKKMAEKVFGSEPVVISLPFRETIQPSDSEGNHFTLFLVGNTDATVVREIRERLAMQQFFWLNTKPSNNESVNAFGPAPPTPTATTDGEWGKIGLAAVNTAGINQLPSDDWPFLYLRDLTIPSLNIRGMLMLSLLSLTILFFFAPVRTLRLNWQMFFLGAGFMLLETKGVVHMALLFGSTWVVNSVVFFAILVMILLSNLFVWAKGPKTLWPYYGLLIAALIVNTYVPMSYFLSLPGAAKVVVSCAIIFVPIFFAGVIFAAAFRDSRQPDVDFGSNIGGVILGGMSEYFSLMLGFNSLLSIAIAFYLLSMLLKPRLQIPAG
jgi:protein-L-isoaspartate O-methyltransferase